MHEILAQISVYVWSVWRFKWLALLCAWILSVAGWAYVWKMPESYVATARISVDTNSVLAPLLEGLTIQPNIDQRIRLMSQTLLSRPNLEKLMRMSDLDLSIQSSSNEERVIQTENLIGQLQEKIQLTGELENSSLYSISYEHRDRVVAKRVVQALMTVFIENSMGDQREDSSGATDFLEQQISDYEKRLIEAEGRLAEFKQRNVGALPGETGGYYVRLEQAKIQLSEARLLLEEMERRRDEVKRQLAGEEPAFFSAGASTSESFTALDLRLQKLYEQKDVLLSRYTEKHPAVIQIDLLIEQLEAERDEEQKSRQLDSDSYSYAGLDESPVYQGMRSMLAEAEATVAERAVRVQEYENRVKELAEKVDNIPLIERELTQLNRDYEVVQSQYDTLLERRESARISKNVELDANDVSFRVIDPAFVPLKPSRPNKVLLNAAVLFAAIGGGIGIALLISLLRPVIFDQRSLAEISGLPYLGTVSLIEPPEARRRRVVKLVVFSVCSLSLVVMFSGVLMAPKIMELI